MNATSKVVPLSLHEDVLDRHYIADPETGTRIEDHALDALKSAAAFGRSTAEKLLSANKAILADKLNTELSNAKRARDTAERMLESITKRIDSAVTVANTERNALLAKLSGPPKDVVSAGHAIEIRSALLRLSPSDRAKAIAEALAEEDEALIASVLSASSLVSGVTKAEKALLKASWGQARYPGEINRAERLNDAIEDLLRGGRAAISLVASLSDGEKIAAAEKSAREAAEAAKV
jgi:hypothetical protein